MAVVMEFTASNGVRVIVRDDCYINKTPEALEAVRREIWRARVQASRSYYERLERSRADAERGIEQAEHHNAAAAGAGV